MRIFKQLWGLDLRGVLFSSVKVWPDTKKRDSNGEVSNVVRLTLKKKSPVRRGYEGLRKKAERRAQALSKKRKRIFR